MERIKIKNILNNVTKTININNDNQDNQDISMELSKLEESKLNDIININTFNRIGLIIDNYLNNEYSGLNTDLIINDLIYISTKINNLIIKYDIDAKDYQLEIINSIKDLLIKSFYLVYGIIDNSNLIYTIMVSNQKTLIDINLKSFVSNFRSGYMIPLVLHQPQLIIIKLLEFCSLFGLSSQDIIDNIIKKENKKEENEEIKNRPT